MSITVPKSLYYKTRFAHLLKPFFKKLGDLETWFLKSEIESIEIIKPIFVTSLARSGTTIISEVLSKHPETIHHCYADFPFFFTPYWRNWIAKKQIRFEEKLSPRAHADRIQINNQSIDAFEEVLWMTFFPNIHQNGFANKLQLESSPYFKQYYKEHIKKLLLIKSGNRYLTKGNYNINRIPEILSLFPTAKFIIPIRHPINHIASLIKQHELFLNAADSNHQIDKQLSASGHFEFGNLREIVSFEKQKCQYIKGNWLSGEEIKGWAHYWLSIYESIMAQIEMNPLIKNAVQIIEYESFCKNTNEEICNILRHCDLESSNFDKIKAEYSSKISTPDYYSPNFNQKQKEEIMRITKPVAKRFGYKINNHN